MNQTPRIITPDEYRCTHREKYESCELCRAHREIDRLMDRLDALTDAVGNHLSTVPTEDLRNEVAKIVHSSTFERLQQDRAKVWEEGAAHTFECGSYQGNFECNACNGIGHQHPDEGNCWNCDGRGAIGLDRIKECNPYDKD